MRIPEIHSNDLPNKAPAHHGSIALESNNKSWTYMLYLDADNDIEADAIRDFEWLEEAGGSDENISIVVLLDRIPGYDSSHGNWSGSRIYNVTEDLSPSNFDSQLMVDLGEVDMASPVTLTDFITYCFDHFPADNYILDLWNHGHAAYGVIDDETSSSHFIVNDIQTAITNALATTAEEICVISMDACDMNTIEVAWELRELCDYFIASETQTNGYPYRSIIERLKLNPDINASSLCEIMIDAYSIHYQYSSSNCLSVVDQTKLLEIPGVFNDFVSVLMTKLEEGNYDEIFAFSREQALQFYDGCWVDLINLVENVIYFLDSPELTCIGEDLLEFMEQLIAYNWQHQRFAGNANGVTIFMPYNVESYEFFEMYCQGQGFCSDMDWQTATLWDEFLDYYWENRICSIVVEPSMLDLGEIIEGCQIEQSELQLFRINLWRTSIYEFACTIVSGDVNFRVMEYNLNRQFEMIGGSYLVNPDDGKTELCRFRLQSGFYFIFVYGNASTTNYEIEVRECEMTELVCNSPITQSTGSMNGDSLGHFKQDLYHYYIVEMPAGNYTISLTNSETTNCQLKIYNESWTLVHFLPSDGNREVSSIVFNQTSEDSLKFIIEIFWINGSGEFTLEVNNQNNPTPNTQNDPTPIIEVTLLIVFLTLSSSAVLLRRKNQTNR
jgi:hypothetical protein